MKKTVEEMKCGYCSVLGHTARTCEGKKRDTAQAARKLKRMQAKKFYYADSVSVKPLLDKLTEEGKTLTLNNGSIKSVHFNVGTKPETAVCQNLIEPLFESIKGEIGSKIEISREPHFKTVNNKNKYLDYLVTVSFKGHRQPIKWLIEAEAPNQTHKGIEQIEDFDMEVPNLNDYRYVVTDGYNWHFSKPSIDNKLEWESMTIDTNHMILGNTVTTRLLDITYKSQVKVLGSLAVLCSTIYMLSWVI